MKTLAGLFQEINRVYPHKMCLLHESKELLALSEGAQESDLLSRGYLYFLESQWGDKFQLYTETEVTKETLGLLEMLINYHLRH